MSRSFNDHKKGWDFPLREAKKWSNKNRRTHGKRLIRELEKAEDPEDVEMIEDIPRDAGKGNILIYDQSYKKLSSFVRLESFFIFYTSTD